VRSILEDAPAIDTAFLGFKVIIAEFISGALLLRGHSHLRLSPQPPTSVATAADRGMIDRMFNAAWMLLFAAVPLLAQDRVKFDTPEVRVIEAVNSPGQRSALHKHDVNRVMIYLDDGHMELTRPDGNVESMRWNAGDVRWSPAGGPHISANVGSTALSRSN